MPHSDHDAMTAADFNFWCAVNSKPFRLIQHCWDDGAVEWDIEIFPGRPEATVAYGTGQANEMAAAIAAFAFIAGVEWGECFAREMEIPTEDLSLTDPDPNFRLPGADDDDDLDDEDFLTPAGHPAHGNAAHPAAGHHMVPYRLPSCSLLQAPPPRAETVDDEDSLATNARALETVLRNFKVRGEIMEVHQGPVVTLYEFEPLPGTKSSTVINLADDIARSMRSITTRIAIVPGRSVIGIELPNPVREKVFFREILESSAFTEFSGHLPLALGKDISGEAVVADLARMPHLLIAGTTGSGKSVGINSMILSLLYRFKPDECRLILVDPKMLELSVYDGIPHLLAPVVTDPDKAVRTLKWAVREMETRYRAMSLLGVRNIEGFNARLLELARTGQKTMHRVQVGFDKATREPIFEEQAIDLQRLPYIVIIVDEMADLMMVAGRELEAAIQRLAQMARAAGIHLIMATQRPSVDVITGTIKANFPTRISFQVTSRIDSRTILGESGAEQLVGQGDMLYMAPGGRITRIHGPFVSDAEVEKVVNHLKSHGEPDYLDCITDDDDESDVTESDSNSIASGDDLYEQAVALVIREGKVSISFVQRHLQVGYNRSARLVERMENEGIVSPANHQGKREVLGRRKSNANDPG